MRNLNYLTNMNKKAIVVYVDNSNIMEIEFSWLYKTWKLYSLDEEYDLVVYHNPEAKHIVDKFVDIITVEMPNIRHSENYKFLNSLYFCLDEWSQPLKKYDYILKTDCDVFLTENLKNYTPNKLCVGQGGFYDATDERKTNYIKHLSKKLGLNYKSISLVGASFYGKTSTVLPVVKRIAEITEYILINESKTQEFKDSGFKMGVASMIAGEVFINYAFTTQHLNLWVLDSKCWQTTKIGSDVLHIHAWHTDQQWSKHAFFRQEYNDWKVNDEDVFKSVANYCQWIATLPFYKLIEYKEKYKNGQLEIDYDLFTEHKRECTFTNDSNVKVLLPDHQYSNIFSTRNNHEVLFRKIHAFLIDKGYIKNNIIDLGAWIGDNSIPWAKRVDGTIFSIDPSDNNCTFIRELVKLNKINNLKIIQKAISETNKTISTQLEYGENLHHCKFVDDESGKTKIESVSLDYLHQINEIYDIGYIHLDVEGLEFNVVRGCVEVINKYKPLLTFEQHLNTDDYVGLSNFMIDLGYEVHMINETLPGCLPDCRNFLCVPTEQKEIINEVINHFNNEEILINFNELQWK